MPDRVKPSFVIFDVRALSPVWHRMIYSCTHMATVGVKGLMWSDDLIWLWSVSGAMLVGDAAAALSDDRKWRHRSTRSRDRRDTCVVRSNEAGKALYQRSLRRVSGVSRRCDLLHAHGLQRPDQLYAACRHDGLCHSTVSEGLQVVPGNHLRMHPRYASSTTSKWIL